MSNLKPLLLHAHHTGPNPFKVAIVLSALSIPYTVKLWDFGDAPNGVKGTTFTALNPNGRVPALEDPNTGVTSWESGACVAYVLRVYDKSGKLGPTPSSSHDEQARVDADKWTYFLVSTLGPMLGQKFWFEHYDSEDNRGAKKRYGGEVERCLGVLEEQLGRSGGQSVLGGDFSAVDAHFYCWVRVAEMAKVSLDPFTKVKAYLKGIEEKPYVKEAYEKVKGGEKA